MNYEPIPPKVLLLVWCFFIITLALFHVLSLEDAQEKGFVDGYVCRYEYTNDAEFLVYDYEPSKFCSAFNELFEENIKKVYKE